jgi:hypothetical protein
MCKKQNQVTDYQLSVLIILSMASSLICARVFAGAKCTISKQLQGEFIYSKQFIRNSALQKLHSE